MTKGGPWTPMGDLCLESAMVRPWGATLADPFEPPIVIARSLFARKREHA